MSMIGFEIATLLFFCGDDVRLDLVDRISTLEEPRWRMKSLPSAESYHLNSIYAQIVPIFVNWHRYDTHLPSWRRTRAGTIQLTVAGGVAPTGNANARNVDAIFLILKSIFIQSLAHLFHHASIRSRSDDPRIYGVEFSQGTSNSNCLLVVAAAETRPSWNAFLKRAERSKCFAPPAMEIIRSGARSCHASRMNFTTVSASVFRAKCRYWERRVFSSISLLLNWTKPYWRVNVSSLWIENRRILITINWRNTDGQPSNSRMRKRSTTFKRRKWIIRFVVQRHTCFTRFICSPTRRDILLDPLKLLLLSNIRQLVVSIFLAIWSERRKTLFFCSVHVDSHRQISMQTFVTSSSVVSTEYQSRHWLAHEEFFDGCSKAESCIRQNLTRSRFHPSIATVHWATERGRTYGYWLYFLSNSEY